jgi:hypothetical protein
VDGEQLRDLRLGLLSDRGEVAARSRVVDEYVENTMTSGDGAFEGRSQLR